MSDAKREPRKLLNYAVEGEGPLVVLLHPVGLDLTCWDVVTDHLRRDFKVIRVDLRGHGKSSLPESDFSLEDYAEDVHQVLVATNFRPAAIVGLSFGGMVAQTLAIRYPSDTSALIFAGTSSAHDAERRQLALQRAEAVADGMAAIVASTLQRWFTPEFLAAGGADRTQERLLADDPRGWVAAWRAMSRLNAAPDLPRIDVPTLCVAGEGDLAVPSAALEAMAAAIPGARFALLPKAPHMMQIEGAEDFSRVAMNFLRQALHAPASGRPAPSKAHS